MTDNTNAPIKQTPLNARHRALGGRMVEFAGWDMPVEYSGITDEHLAVRTRAGLFDVTHMGQVEIAGPHALDAVQWISSNDASRLKIGQAQYAGLTTPQGTFVDDMLVYRFADSHFLLVINASNVDKDYAWIVDHTRKFSDAAAVNTSARYALIALQGPVARQVMQTLTDVDLSAIKYYWFAHGEVAGVRGTLSRTGYTGEDGFEVFAPPQMAVKVWDAILEAGKPYGVIPAGLGARDTLRLEAAMRLYGNDIDDTTTVLQADLEWIVAWNKGDFLGRNALQDQKNAGVPSKLVGFEMVERGIARHGHAVLIDGKPRRPCDERHADTVPEEGPRHGVRADRPRGRGHGHRNRHPRTPLRREGRAVALLQTTKGLSMYPKDFKYTKDHEWIQVAGDSGKVGITDYAQKQLGDVVYLELPQIGRTLKQGESFGTVESVKAVSELFSPVSGQIVSVNTALAEKPERVNSEPHASWMIEIKVANPAELKTLADAAAYEDQIK